MRKAVVIYISFISLLLTAAAVRFLNLVAYAGSWDAADFAMALERYDIFSMQPHFPGYPLFILAGYVMNTIYAHPVIALSAVSALFGSLTIVLFYIWLHFWLDRAALRLAVTAFFAFNPLIWLQHVQPMSESMGLFGVMLFIVLIQLTSRSKDTDSLTRNAIIASIVLGLTFGVRVSYFPMAFLMFYPIWRFYVLSGYNVWTTLRLFTLLLAVGLLSVSVWLVPTAMTEGGLIRYWELGMSFATGHFTEWGGTIWTDSSWYDRLYQTFIVQLIFAGWFGVLGDVKDWNPVIIGLILPLVVSLIGWVQKGRWREVRGRILLLFLLIVPYSLWLYIGQNVDKPRHILPLLPVLFIIIGIGIERYIVNKRGSLHYGVVGMAIVLALIAGTVRGNEVVQASGQPSPSIRLVQYISAQYEPEEIVVYTWEEQRLFHYYSPAYPVERVRSYEYWRNSLLSQVETRKTVLLTNAVVRGFAMEGKTGPNFEDKLLEIARFKTDPLVEPVYHEVILYLYNP